VNLTRKERNAFLIGTAQRDDLGLWSKDISRMTGPRRTFRLIWELEAEVNNGGFHQYANNSSIRGAPYIIDALKEVGAMRTAAIVTQALACFGDVAWQDDGDRDTAANSVSDDVLGNLEEVDQAFFRYEDDLTAILFDYVQRNLEAFLQPKSQ
jgi:hypothetical protein